ncbi:shikimate dehydrogenase [Demequina mangrovi]|uniref:Shikimate dehydrogenase (NADP(+)) n=1 Tax=Demequina mangrovi TaxID=1043493 RepID=A0A1H6Z374_9MICO|nr:shikimate dehydrogenase [Demequina mangrovi]SEJ47848.1 shikimate dehydrogenase [Demequina mangrovi]
MTAATTPRPTVLVGLIGTGIAPSLSPALHEREGARHGIGYVYRTIEVSPREVDEGGLGPLIVAARRLGYDGLNITHPAKQRVIPLLDALAPSAEAVGAVNTVVFEDGRAIGHNTDATGFGRAMDDALAGAARDEVVLVGAGGAGAAVARALVDRGVGTLAVVDADEARAAALAAQVGARAAAPPELPRLLASADGLVNATPLGMADHPGSAVDPALLDPRMFVADIVYRPVETALLIAARARGCRVMPGTGMAMHQAADAFEIFTGEAADRRAMLADLEDLVAQEAA